MLNLFVGYDFRMLKVSFNPELIQCLNVLALDYDIKDHVTTIYVI